jgi:hypothetical protein
MGKIRAWHIVGAIYLLCIPLFAAVYSWCVPRNSFYQSTIKIENSYTAHAKDITQGLCDAVLPREQQETQRVADYTFAPSDLKCTELRIDQDDRLAFTMEVTLHNKRVSEDELVAIPVVLTFDSFNFKVPAPELLKFVPQNDAHAVCAVGVIHPIKIDMLSAPLLSPDPSNSPADALKRSLFFDQHPPQPFC